MIDNLQVITLASLINLWFSRTWFIYEKVIYLQSEVSRLRNELAEKESQLNAKPTEKAVDDEISLLNSLSQETSENVQERINLQKALIELEETNHHNRKELQHLDDAIAKQQVFY